MINTLTHLPPLEEMHAAFLRSDSEYDGVFFVAVKTTGIFCRPTCPARRPNRENIRFFANAGDCLSAGFRACKRCRPLECTGEMPGWVRRVVTLCEADAGRRWSDREIADQEVEPVRLRRWFLDNLGITFHRFLRARRLAQALAQLSVGEDLTQVAYTAGYESLSGFRDAFQKTFGLTPGAAVGQGQPVLVNRIQTPLGPMVVAADNQALRLLEFADRRMLETQFRRLSQRLQRHFCPGENDLIRQTQRELQQYFAGQRRTFELPLEPVGTEFQKLVWSRLLQIPFGSTTSYEQIASDIGKERAQRAVGKANGDNCLAIVVPCHRVIRSNGSLSGYGGGLRRKEWLLTHEVSTGRGD